MAGVGTKTVPEFMNRAAAGPAPFFFPSIPVTSGFTAPQIEKIDIAGFRDGFFLLLGHSYHASFNMLPGFKSPAFIWMTKPPKKFPHGGKQEGAGLDQAGMPYTGLSRVMSLVPEPDAITGGFADNGGLADAKCSRGAAGAAVLKQGLLDKLFFQDLQLFLQVSPWNQGRGDGL